MGPGTLKDQGYSVQHRYGPPGRPGHLYLLTQLLLEDGHSGGMLLLYSLVEVLDWPAPAMLALALRARANMALGTGHLIKTSGTVA